MLSAWLRNISKIPKTQQITTKCLTICEQLRDLRTVANVRNEINTPTTTGQPESNETTEQNKSRKDVALDFGNREAHVPTFNLAAQVNNSATLQQLVSLGVDLNSIERRKGLGQFVLQLEFEENVKPYLIFLSDQGVSADVFGQLITKNPLLFKESVDNLQTRVEYMKSKRFTAEAITRIITQNPYWLMFSTKRIDRRLGYFQKEFDLSGHDLRLLATKQPRLITYNMEHIRKSVFTLREEMGFTPKELSKLIVRKPRLMMTRKRNLLKIMQTF